jgi:hypothetical protein
VYTVLPGGVVQLYNIITHDIFKKTLNVCVVPVCVCAPPVHMNVPGMSVLVRFIYISIIDDRCMIFEIFVFFHRSLFASSLPYLYRTSIIVSNVLN